MIPKALRQTEKAMSQELSADLAADPVDVGVLWLDRSRNCLLLLRRYGRFTKQIIRQGGVLVLYSHWAPPVVRGDIPFAHVAGYRLQIFGHHFVGVWSGQGHANFPELSTLDQSEGLALGQCYHMCRFNHRYAGCCHAVLGI